MEKKVVLLIINRGAEVDWILPILNQLSKKFLIYSYFRSQKSFNSLKSNNELFNLWLKINNDYHIEKKTNNFFWKLLRFFFSYFNINSDFFHEKIHDLDYIINKIKIKNNLPNVKIAILFSELGIYSGWVETYKKKKNKPLIIHFPPNPNIYLQKIDKKFKLSGDLCLIGSKKSITSIASIIDKKKIKPFGVPKYDDWWIKKISSNKFDFSKKKIRNKKIISVAFNSYFEVLDSVEFLKLEDQLHKLMKTLCSFKNILIIFKIHPMLNSPHFLKILKMYDKRKWLLSKSHLIKLSKISNCLICNARSGAALDALSVNIPTFHLWPTRKIELNDNVLNKLKIVNVVKNEIELKKNIKLAINNPNNKLWRDQRNLFKKNFKNCKNSTKKYERLISNYLN